MNYRHHYHAGNFADLVKHAILLHLIGRLKADGKPLTVIDTHAGAGLYDLEAVPAQKSGEAAVGIGRLFVKLPDGIDPDGIMTPLLEQVRAFNPEGLRVYPGSPALAISALDRGDRVIACELRPEEAAELQTNLRKLRGAAGPDVIVRAVDGYGYAAGLTKDNTRKTLILIDPPYEQGDDYDRVVDCAGQLMQMAPRPVVAIWAPIKDLETLDHLLRRLEQLSGVEGYVAQTRLRPLTNPMSMNGCAMVVLGDGGSANYAAAASDLVANLCGDAGASGRLILLGQ